MAQPAPRPRWLLLLVVVALGVFGVCVPHSHVPAEVSAAEYDVYRAYLQSLGPGRRIVVADHTDPGRIQLCAHLSKFDKNLLWNLVPLQGKSFPLDAGRLGSATAGAGPYVTVSLSRVALAGGNRVGVLQVSTAECNPTCGPARHELLTASKDGAAWTFRATGCAFTR